MITLILSRLYYMPDRVVGMLQADDLTLFTLEPPWLDNKPNLSCIPVGVYKVEFTPTEKHGLALGLVHVPDRSAILIHAGNVPQDTEGCILVGQSVSLPEDGFNLVDSRAALELLKGHLEKQEGIYVNINNDALGGRR